MIVFPRKTSLVCAVFIASTYKGKAITEDVGANTQHPTSLSKKIS